MKVNRWIVVTFSAVFAVWIVHTVVVGVGTRPNPGIVGFSAGAIGDLVLPPDEVAAEFKAAGASMDWANTMGRIFAVADDVLAWASFLATTVIAVTLATYGRTPASEGIQGPRTLPSPARRLLPVLAAVAAACTAAGNMSSAQSADWYDTADERHQAIMDARSELAEAETVTDQRIVLDRLGNVSRR